MSDPIVLNCYTYKKEVYEQFPVCKTIKALPSWWKNIDDDRQTIKQCPGFLEYFASGFTVPLWTDMMFTIGTSVDEGVSVNIDEINVHPTYQRGEYLPETKYQQLKLIAPWLIRCNEDIKFVFSANTWCLDNPEEFIIPPGVVDYKNQFGININSFLVYNGTTRSVHLKAGMPIVSCIPMSDRKIEIVNHLIDENIWIQLNNASPALTKCPFHKS